jgi:hypothetical protein
MDLLFKLRDAGNTVIDLADCLTDPATAAANSSMPARAPRSKRASNHSRERH